MSIDIWTFIKDVLKFFASLLNRLRGGKTQNRIIDKLVQVDFGGGQPHAGKPDLWIRNNSDRPFSGVTLTIHFKRSGRFKKWLEYDKKTWQLIKPYQATPYTLDFRDVVNKLKVTGQTKPFPTQESLPDYNDMLYPKPVIFKIDVEFAIGDSLHELQYQLHSTCIYPHNLITSPTNGAWHWVFEKIE